MYQSIYSRADYREWLVWVTLALASLFGSAAVALADTPTRVPLRAVSPDTPPSVVRVSQPGSQCSGTVIHSGGGKSLVLTCAHCYGGDRGYDGRYPTTVTVRQLATGRDYPGQAVAGRIDRDMAIIVVEGTLPAAEVDATAIRPGDELEHWGITSRYAYGIAVPVNTPRNAPPTHLLRSTLSSIPGDSGAGIFRRGKLVAVNWGYWTSSDGTVEQGGTPVGYVGDILLAVELIAKLWPELRKLWGGDVGPVIPPVEPPPPPPVTPPDVIPPPPPVYYPPARRPICQRPILGRILPRCR